MPFSLPSPFSITRFYFFVYKYINQSFALALATFVNLYIILNRNKWNTLHFILLTVVALSFVKKPRVILEYGLEINRSPN